VDDYGTGKLFNGGGTASQINFAELWGQAVSGNATDFGVVELVEFITTADTHALHEVDDDKGDTEDCFVLAQQDGRGVAGPGGSA